MKIYVENIKAYALFNFARDKALGLIEENWETVEEEYLEEARHDKDIVLTEDEAMAIICALRA